MTLQLNLNINRCGIVLYHYKNLCLVYIFKCFVEEFRVVNNILNLVSVSSKKRDLVLLGHVNQNLYFIKSITIERRAE